MLIICTFIIVAALTVAAFEPVDTTLADSLSISYNINKMLREYETPVSKATDLYFSFSFINSTQEDYEPETSGNLSLNLYSFYESMDYGYSLRSIFATRLANEYDNTRFSTSLVLDGSFKYYLWRKGIFGLAESNTDFDFGNNNIYSLAFKGDEVTYRIRFRSQYGIGYGRYINIVPLLQALRIEEYLISEGELSGSLDETTIKKIAKIIERYTDYKTNYKDTYLHEYYKDIENVLIQSGKLTKSSITAFGLYRVREVLFVEHFYPRYSGIEFGIKMGQDCHYSYFHMEGQKRISMNLPDSISWEVLDDERYLSELDYSLTAHLNIAYPVTRKLHLSTELSLSYLEEKDCDDYNFEFHNTLLFSYELTNRIDWHIRYSYSDSNRCYRTYPFDDIYIHIIDTELNFYMENHMYFTIEASLNKRYRKGYSSSLILYFSYDIL
jgi:hypothetical protein